ncbi:MAG TPA: heme biosynthesis HemY N-terminal domain-containing protein [Gammaproteobacteria bacterium]|nr:heme biosynthesis HemY N-terminal domain-containing protein [Gammaproteobacteria bacterium]
MRRLIVVLLFLIASVWFGAAMVEHPGHALLTYDRWVIELPLWLLVLGLLLIFLVLHCSLRLFNLIRHFPTRRGEWFAKRRFSKALDKTQQGLLDMWEQQWINAERHLLEGIHQDRNPIINYLSAAEAARAQQAYERSDVYLQKAYQAAPQNEVVIGLVQTKLQLEQGLVEQAMATLRQLRKLAPDHPEVLRLLEKIYIRLADWQNLLELLPALRKARMLDAEQAAAFEKNIYCEMLEEAERKNKSIHAVRELWNRVPQKIRLQPEVLERYAQLLKSDKKSAEEIEPLIRKLLQKEWHENLVKIYGSLSTDNPTRHLTVAESWLKYYGKQDALLLTLGRLCLRCQLWGKARSYLEEGLNQHVNLEAQLELAKLLEQLGEPQLALRYYRDGLELATTTS